MTTVLALLVWRFPAHGAVRDFGKRFALALVSETDSFSLNLSPTVAGSTTHVTYQPNTAPTSGVEVTAYGLTLAYRTVQVLAKSIWGAALGYNAESFYAGLGGIYNSTTYHTESITFAVNLASLRSFFGVRF